ncbi:NB-ARC domains-containing protein [Tanacetum coccineum]
MAASSIAHKWKYDVFVSFRGKDIRRNFMDHLFNDFKQKGIFAFRDDNELPKGEDISPHLYKAIEESRFLIVIFSKNYASSSWCLRELVKILQCKQMGKPKHEVQIIFYDVKPDVVRKQTGSYAKAFAKHQVSNRPEVDNWKEALSMATNLSGWDLQDMTNGYEYKFIDFISKDILKKLCDGPLHVGETMVGIDFHFDKLNLSGFVGSHKVNMIGICGISDEERTTLSKAIYNLDGFLFFQVTITEAVEVLVLLLGKSSQKDHIDANDFADMKKLRILKIYQEEKVSDEKLELEDHNSFKRLKIIKLRYCCNLTTTPDFSEITNLKELSLEGCVNLVSVHPLIGMLKRLVVLNLRDCERLQNFPSIVEMDSLQVLNLMGFLKVDQLPEALGRIKNLTELHVDRTAITELPSFVSSLINLKSLSFGGKGRIQPRWWTSISAPFGLLKVPESTGGLSCLEILNLTGNNFTSLPGSLNQLSHLQQLWVYGCKKLEVLPELPPSVRYTIAADCTSLIEVSGSSIDPFKYRNNNFVNCPKLFKNASIDSEGSISKTQCLDSSITSQDFIHQLSAFLGYVGFETKRCELFLQDIGSFDLDIVYHGNCIPEWFTNRSMKNNVKVELPSDWCYDKLRGFGTCVVFKCKKPFSKLKGFFVKNFDGASLITENYIPDVINEFLKKEEIGINESYLIWLHYTMYTWKWKEAKNFVTLCFEENNEDVEVKECGVRLICDEDLLSMFQDLPTPSQHGGAMRLDGRYGSSSWSW